MTGAHLSLPRLSRNSAKQVRFTLIWLVLCCDQAHAEPISKILFEGNEVTQEKVLRQELLIQEGDDADPRLIEESRLAIMNLGLFKNVVSRLEQEGDAQRLIYTVDERFFLLPIPRLGIRAKDGDAQEGVGSYTYGIELRYDNLLGLNQRLKLVHEIEEPREEGGDYIKESSIRYTVPRIVDSVYQLDMSLKQVKKQIFEYENDINTGRYHSTESSGSFSVSRWIDTTISRGWRGGAGISVEDINYYEQVGSGLAYVDNFTLALTLGLDRSDTQEYPYHRDGEQYGYSISLGLPQLGSDSSFTRHHLYYRRYRPLEFADSNLNTQFQLYAANGSGDTYGIGNSALLRGYDDDYAKGNALFLANLEYHHHMSGYPQLRGVVFTDIGNAWPSVSDIDLGDMLTDVGIGLRWRVQSFVDVTLRMDYAYALSSETTKLTLNTKASF